MLFSIFILLAETALQVQPPRIDFTSEPRGATVLVDGASRGVTPLTLVDLTPGRHLFTCRAPGYVEETRWFEAVPGRPAQENAALVPERGLLLLKSEPAGCGVVIDGETRGETPCLVTDLTTRDAHKVRLLKAGYRPADLVVKFEGRRPLVRSEKLVLDSGIVTVVTDPPGAQVTVNGIDRGVTPLTVSEIPKGRATFKIVREGYRDEVRELAVIEGVSMSLSLVLAGLPGTLTLSSVPEGARIYVDGKFSGKAPLSLPGLAPGTYLVRAERDGYATQERNVTIERGAAPHEEFRLTDVSGRIEVRTSPVGATVILDGRVVGVTRASGPDAEVSDVFGIDGVSEGEHVLTLRKDGFAELVRHPKVENRKTVAAKLRMARVFKPNIEIVTDQETYRGILVRNTPDAVVIEVKLGVERSFSRSAIRKIKLLDTDK